MCLAPRCGRFRRRCWSMPYWRLAASRSSAAAMKQSCSGTSCGAAAPETTHSCADQIRPPPRAVSIELIIQSHLRAVDALERVVRAVSRCAGGSDAKPARRIGLVQGEVEVLDLDRPFAGPGPFDAAAGFPECAHSAVART